ncbi:hypothetical protein BGX28_000446 [Mortierella sp. GBA30]|nr:hypothetical protein BGX28_000446 [Mortierella sp. GBA30]
MSTTPVVSALGEDATCQICFNDVVHSVPGCDSVDNSRHSPIFNDYTEKEKQCLCNLSANPSILNKCNDTCAAAHVPINRFIQIYEVMYQNSCNGTKYAASANSGSPNSGVHGASLSASSIAMSATAVVLSVVAMIVA